MSTDIFEDNAFRIFFLSLSICMHVWVYVCVCVCARAWLCTKNMRHCRSLTSSIFTYANSFCSDKNCIFFYKAQQKYLLARQFLVRGDVFKYTNISSNFSSPTHRMAFKVLIIFSGNVKWRRQEPIHPHMPSIHYLTFFGLFGSGQNT